VRFRSVTVGEAEAASRTLERELSQADADLTDSMLWGEGVWAGAIC